MYPRLFKLNDRHSYFVFGPRGTGKTTWLKANYKDAVYLDLLSGGLYQQFLASPEKLKDHIPVNKDQLVIIDEIQRVPALLNEVHRIIEGSSCRFILTGSSARKLRRGGVNLLAGRAIIKDFHPLTVEELGSSFVLEQAIQYGMLPSVWSHDLPRSYLSSYIATYLREEVFQEGLVRNVPSFSKFLEISSFSQGSPVNMTSIARECGVDRKTVENYFSITIDLLFGVFLSAFTKRAKRAVRQQPKFYFFDAGVYRSIRPAGPLDDPGVIDGIALETLVMQMIRAVNDYHQLGYELHYWQTQTKHEVDFVLYGERGIIAIETKRGARIDDADLRGLELFMEDYPMAKAYLFYGGEAKLYKKNISIVPVGEALITLKEILGA